MQRISSKSVRTGMSLVVLSCVIDLRNEPFFISRGRKRGAVTWPSS
jgi:hypothetical protein